MSVQQTVEKLRAKQTETVVPFVVALERIRKERHKFYLNVGTWAPFLIQNAAKEYKRGSHGFGGLIPVTREQALKFLEESFPAHWRSKLSLNLVTVKGADRGSLMSIGTPPR